MSLFPQTTVTFSDRLTYLLNGAIVSLLPVYLFVAIKGLSLADYGIFVLIVSFLTTVALSLAYHNKRSSLILYAAELVKVGASGPTDELKTSTESLYYGIFFVNLFFLGLVVFFTESIFSGLGVTLNYVLSCLTPPAAILYLTSPVSPSASEEKKSNK